MEPQGLDLLLAYADDPLFPGAVRYLTDFDIYAMYALAALLRTGDVVIALGLHHSAHLVRVKQGAAGSAIVVRTVVPAGPLGTIQLADTVFVSRAGANVITKS